MEERLIGLCMAAGGVTTGFDSVLAEVRKGRVKFLLIASDASDRTKKQLTDKCTQYETKYRIGPYDGTELARMLGKKSTCMAAAFTGRGPWESIWQKIGCGEENNCCEERKDD